MNKRGQRTGFGVPLLILGILLLATFVLAGSSDSFDLWPDRGLEGFKLDSQPLEDVFQPTTESSRTILQYLNYVVGEVPAYLVDQVKNPKSAGLIIIALWVMFLLIFFDMFNMFSPFSRPVTVIVSVLMVVIAANINVVSFTLVYFMTFLAVLGSLSILLSLGYVILLFGFFHFGTQGVRRWVRERRQMDAGFRAEIGAARAAEGIAAAARVGEAAERAGRR